MKLQQHKNLATLFLITFMLGCDKPKALNEKEPTAQISQSLLRQLMDDLKVQSEHEFKSGTDETAEATIKRVWKALEAQHSLKSYGISIKVFKTSEIDPFGNVFYGVLLSEKKEGRDIASQIVIQYDSTRPAILFVKNSDNQLVLLSNLENIANYAAAHWYLDRVRSHPDPQNLKRLFDSVKIEKPSVLKDIKIAPSKNQIEVIVNGGEYTRNFQITKHPEGYLDGTILSL